MDPIDIAYADGRIPNTTSRAFLEESRDYPCNVSIAFVCALTFTIVALRCVSRLFVVKHFGFDDVLAILGFAMLVAFTGLAIRLINLGSGRHYDYIQYVLPLDTVNETETLDFIAHIIYTLALFVCRLSGLVFYRRLCAGSRLFVRSTYVAIGILVAGVLAQILLLILHCLPLTSLWPYAWQPEVNNFTCLAWGIVYVTNSGISLLCDLLLFGFPLAIIRFVQVSQKRKQGLSLVLLPGILVIAISIARIVMVVRGQWDADQSWTYDQLLCIETAEIGGTLIALSFPGLKPMIDKYVLHRGATQASYAERGPSDAGFFGQRTPRAGSRGNDLDASSETELAYFKGNPGIMRDVHVDVDEEEYTSPYASDNHRVARKI